MKNCECSFCGGLFDSSEMTIVNAGQNIICRDCMGNEESKCMECGEDVIAPLKLCGGCNADAIRAYSVATHTPEETEPIDLETGEVCEIFGRK